MMYVIVSLLLIFFIPVNQMVYFDVNDVDMYGKMLVANDDLVISIIDRMYPSVGIYRPYSSSDFCRIDMIFLSPYGVYIMLVSIARDGSATPNKFFFQGVDIINYRVVWGVVAFSISPCGWLWYNLFNWWGTTDYPILGVSTASDIYLYADTDFTYIIDINSGISSFVYGRQWPDGSNFFPYAIDIAYGGWGVIAGLVCTADVYVPTLYRITFPSSVISSGLNLYSVTARWVVPFVYSWQHTIARPSTSSNGFDPMYGLSLSINDNGDILFGIQSMNTVYHLYVDPTNPISFTIKGSRMPSITMPSLGFGKNVAWLDNTTAVILANNVSLDYTVWYSSRIEIYDLSNGQQLSNSQQPYSYFPTIQQPIYSSLSNKILLMTASYAGSIVFMDSMGQIYLILPSPTGYYSATNIGNTFGTGIYFSSPSFCPDGTTRYGSSGGKHLFDSCVLCPEGTYRSSSSSSINTSSGCLPCDTTKYFCPFGSVTQLPLTFMNQISQAVAFPKSPDLNEFEDILLLNIFNTNFQISCLISTPFFWTLIVFIIGLIILIIMGILQLTGKCGNFQSYIESIFKHFDIVNDGERWVTGVLSLSIFVIIIYAALFTNSFIKQYPGEESQAPDFTCDDTLRNSQYSSQLQASGASIPENAEQILNLLESQRFTLIVTLLNTIVNRNITVQQTIGTITTTLSTILSIPIDGCLMISCNLTANIATINITISNTYTIGGVRISLSGPAINNGTNQVKELYFANSFTMSNRTMSQEPYFNVELIQVINETQPLDVSGETYYSGLWIPIYQKDDDRNFYTQTDYERYSVNASTTLTIDISKADYYIYNVEKPTIRTTSVIFKNILFASMCMELFGFAFLILKLAIIPLLRLIVNLARPKQNEAEGHKNNIDDDDDESENDAEDKNEQESEDDDRQIEQKVRLEPGVNEWYIPETHT